MKILACSDIHRNKDFTHELVTASKDTDILVCAGDFATQGKGAKDIFAIIQNVQIPTLIVSGNHDNSEELQEFCANWPNGHFLHGNSFAVDGISFFGLGREIPRLNYMPWNEYLSESEARNILSTSDPYDILITHTPPYGHVDTEVGGDHDGSKSILQAIEEHQPKLHLCGHIHGCWGQKSKIGRTAIHNLGPSLNWFNI